MHQAGARRRTALRVLILSAEVGSGHHSAAVGLREELRLYAPEVDVTVANGLGAEGGRLRTLLERSIRWQLTHIPLTYSASYAAGVRLAAGRALAGNALFLASRSRLEAIVRREQPDLIVSTYPGITAPLGRMRRRREVGVPVCAVVTDIASLHFWAHPGVDHHLAAYPQSLGEIRAISGESCLTAIRPPLHPTHWTPRSRRECLQELALDPSRPLIVISGGGWGIGDLAGAVGGALGVPGAQLVVVCGRNIHARSELEREHAGNARVRILGYTDAMAQLLAAAGVLVHSTGGMTCLEAAAHGCPVVAYGFNRGHVGHNIRAMVSHGLITSASTPAELTGEIRRALERPVHAAPPFTGRAWASSALLGAIGAPASATAGGGADAAALAAGPAATAAGGDAGRRPGR